MKNGSLTVILLFLWSINLLFETTFCHATEQIKSEQKELLSLKEALGAGGLTGLLEEVKKSGNECPTIHSNYYALKLSKNEPALADLEQAKRDFGLLLAKALESKAVDLRKEVDSGERASQIKELFELRDWLGSAKGYGNYILLHRCENLAVVPLAYLAVDLKYPIAEIQSFSERFITRKDDSELRAFILNSESPKQFIFIQSGTDAQQDDQVAIAWISGSEAAQKAFEKKGISIEARKRALLPEDLEFFWDDVVTGSGTTVNYWKFKLHRMLTYGLRCIQIDDVRKLIRFRFVVGYFPSQPPDAWRPGGARSATFEAFDEAWTPYQHTEGPIFETAARVYDEVTAKKFIDFESQSQSTN